MIRGGCERTQVPKRNPFFPEEEKFDDDLRRMSPISSEEGRVGPRWKEGKEETSRHFSHVLLHWHGIRHIQEG